ncbi:hypothetical protein C5167_010521 [Papaver somniferum]|uniref:Secreted protein n=1 Tax=Papaver somniferum TaxID=3469 RepID=A0A4Y7K3J3_PAPSO|nr:hypothetical protein C5167_010521 [Papaver somniferum]
MAFLNFIVFGVMSLSSSMRKVFWHYEPLLWYEEGFSHTRSFYSFQPYSGCTHSLFRSLALSWTIGALQLKPRTEPSPFLDYWCASVKATHGAYPFLGLLVRLS